MGQGSGTDQKVKPKVFKLTPPREFIPHEMDEQAAIFEWANMMSGKQPELALLNASLNGVRLPIGLAVKAKRGGMRIGYPDLNLPVARGSAHGLFIELKRVKGGTQTIEQKWWEEQLRIQGYECYVARGARQAIDLIREYLERPKTIVVPFDPVEEEGE